MPMPLDNKHVNFLDDTCFEPFNGKFVEQIYRATDSICAEMRECINVNGNDQVRAAFMAKKTIISLVISLSVGWRHLISSWMAMSFLF